MAMITGGELVVRTLVQAGVTNVFGLHGAHLETLFQSCTKHGIRITDTRHEVAAGHAAEGYARAGRRLGVVMVTAGPGFTNVVTSIANAHLDQAYADRHEEVAPEGLAARLLPLLDGSRDRASLAAALDAAPSAVEEALEALAADDLLSG